MMPVPSYQLLPFRELGRRFDKNTQALGANESLEQAARRLAESVRLAIEAGFYYDELISEEPQIA